MPDTNYDLLFFLNKNVTPKIKGLDRIVSLKPLKNIHEFNLNSSDVKETDLWVVEVYSKNMDECESFKILDILPKYISAFGENCDLVHVRTISP